MEAGVPWAWQPGSEDPIRGLLAPDVRIGQPSFEDDIDEEPTGYRTLETAQRQHTISERPSRTHTLIQGTRRGVIHDDPRTRHWRPGTVAPFPVIEHGQALLAIIRVGFTKSTFRLSIQSKGAITARRQIHTASHLVWNSSRTLFQTENAHIFAHGCVPKLVGDSIRRSCPKSLCDPLPYSPTAEISPLGRFRPGQ